MQRAPGRKSWAPRCRFDFVEPRPSDLSFGEFGLTAKRGRILAADNPPLAHTPAGAGGLESACIKALAGTNGVYDKKLPVKKRNEKASPKPGLDVQTTLVRPVLIAGEARSCATNGGMQIVSPAAADAIVRMLKTPMPSTVQMCEHDCETGRSVYSPTNYIASCAGYSPADRPQHVIVVSFVKPRTAHTGDEVAKPVLDAIKGSR